MEWMVDMSKLTYEQICKIDWNSFTAVQVDELIAAGAISEDDIVHYYNNSQWRDELQMSMSKFVDTDSGYRNGNYVVDLDKMVLTYCDEDQWNIRVNGDGDIEYQQIGSQRWLGPIDPVLQDRTKTINYMAEKELLREE